MSIGEAKSETADSFLRPAQVTLDDQGFRCQNFSCIGQELIVLNLPSIRSLVGDGNGEQHFSICDWISKAWKGSDIDMPHCGISLVLVSVTGEMRLVTRLGDILSDRFPFCFQILEERIEHLNFMS